MGKGVFWAVVVGCAASAISGCGGEDEAAPDPHRQCQDFLDAWCNKNAECALPSERARVREDCEFVVELDIDCGQVKSVGPNYSMCIESISTSTCKSIGIDLPGWCQGILLR
jgi:hypothetical protein